MDIYIDGSSMGNPGDAGVGVIFSRAEVPIKNISRYIGHQTNNVAEYTALITALQEALEMNVRKVTIFSDSQLLCRQISGDYKVKNKNIRHLFEQAKMLLRGFDTCRIQQIPRELNKGADKLARLAIKEERSRIGRIAAHGGLKVSGEESPSSRGQRSG